MKIPDKFESKEQWLQWRGTWRQAYREVSDSIRAIRGNLKSYQRDGNRTAAAGSQHALRGAVPEARTLMMMLDHAKAKVREALRAKGIPAPDPKVRLKQPPRPKKIWTAEDRDRFKALAEHRRLMASADAHSD